MEEKKKEICPYCGQEIKEVSQGTYNKPKTKCGCPEVPRSLSTGFGSCR